MDPRQAREIAEIEAALAEISAEPDGDLDPQPATSAPVVAFVTTLDPDAPTRTGLTPELRAIMRAASVRIAADNEAQREARNARRRDSPEYAQQLADQRAAREAAKGAPLRAYTDLSVLSGEEAERHRKHQVADAGYRRDKRRLGWSEEAIEAGLTALRAKRARQAARCT